MATITGVNVKIAKGVLKTRWAAFNAVNDVSNALDASMYPDKTVSIDGTFNTATIVIEGSNNTATGPYQTLNDSRGEGNALSFTATNHVTILENPQYIRARLTSATTSAGRSIDVTVISQSHQR